MAQKWKPIMLIYFYRIIDEQDFSPERALSIVSIRIRNFVLLQTITRSPVFYVATSDVNLECLKCL